MRRLLIGVAAFGLLLAACAEENPVISPTDTGTPPATAADCAAGVTAYVNPDTLTVGTDNPAFPPYFAGGETKENPDWEFNDPNTGEGFEAAVAYEVAARMGFTSDQVDWVVAPFNQTYKPGPKHYDFAIEQISYTEKRAQAVDFSESYYDVNQALVAVKGTPITKASGIADLKDYTLAAQIGTTNYDFIANTIQPSEEPGVYNSTADAVAAINAGQVDGLVVDLPTALFLADPFVQEVKKGVVVGQFANLSGEHFGITFEKGNPLVGCVNLALQEMKADGTLESITQEWLSEKTNVGEVPVLS